MKLVFLKIYNGFAIERGLIFRDYLDISTIGDYFYCENNWSLVQKHCIAKTEADALTAFEKYKIYKTSPKPENLNKRKVLKWFL